MIDYLELVNVGPAPQMRLDFAPRLNILTGDNGLGKTFTLDVVWWVLTGAWRTEPALPMDRRRPRDTPEYQDPPKEADARQRLTYLLRDGEPEVGEFSSVRQRWQHEFSCTRSLAAFLPTDSGMLVFDPSYMRSHMEHLAGLGGIRWDHSTAGREPIEPGSEAWINLSPGQVWSGVRGRNGQSICNGLLRDWVEWQVGLGGDYDEFKVLEAVLAELSPPDLPIRPAKPRKHRLGDDTTYPFLALPYGEVPVTQASAGMRRILALAYLLTWTWSRHVQSSDITGQKAVRRLVLLVDELESHLHPQWQRAIVPALLAAVKHLSSQLEVQLIASTHAPLVLASLEPEFDQDKDALFNFALADGVVTVDKVPFSPRGTADNWLGSSEVFGLREPRAREQEELLIKLSAAAADPGLDAGRFHELTAKLAESSVPDIDPVRRRWHDLGLRKGFVDDPR